MTTAAELRLTGLPGIRAVRGPDREVRETVHYDTDTLRLIRAGTDGGCYEVAVRDAENRRAAEAGTTPMAGGKR